MSGNMMGEILGGGSAVAGGAATLLGQPEIGIPLLMSGVQTATQQEKPQGGDSQGSTDAASSLLDEAGMMASVGDPGAGAMEGLAQSMMPQSQSAVGQAVNAAAKDLGPASPALGLLLPHSPQGIQQQEQSMSDLAHSLRTVPHPDQSAANEQQSQQPGQMPQSAGRAGASAPQPPNPMAILHDYHSFLNSLNGPSQLPNTGTGGEIPTAMTEGE